MRLIIAGSRTLTDYDLQDALRNFDIPGFYRPTLILCGKARGIDTWGERWAVRAGIPILAYPAKWNLYGNSAGYKRNQEMAANADKLLAIWDGQSLGTKHMIDIMCKMGKKVFIYIPERYRVPSNKGGDV